MSAADQIAKSHRFAIAELVRAYGALALLAAAWLSLYGPIYLEFAQTVWTREENGHAPFIMAICIGVAWARLQDKSALTSATRREFLFGVIALAAGLSIFLLGRIGQIDFLLSGSQTLVAASIALCAFGVAGVKRLWFPLLLSLYLIVWPGWAIDAATGPLKRIISELVSNGLYAAGLPIAHSGAVISVGSYELLVADACAGLNSLISLTAIGAVYLFVAKRRSWKTNLTVMAALAPLAIFANIIRVGLLVLVTYFYGYDAGQSYLHEAAGMIMFAIALTGVFVVDAVAAARWERNP